MRISIQGWAVECQMESELNYNRFRKTKLNKMGAYWKVHYSLRAWQIVILLRISLLRKRLTKSFALEDTAGQGASSKLGSAFKTTWKIPDLVQAQKDWWPQITMYTMTPMLHTSLYHKTCEELLVQHSMHYLQYHLIFHLHISPKSSVSTISFMNI